MRHENTLVIPDLHQPFTLKNALDFVWSVGREYKCTRIVFLGDIVDQHAISYHEKDPDGKSAGDEWEASVKSLKAWYKAFPSAKVCIGNHDALIYRKAYTAGLSKRFVRSLSEIYECPRGWSWDYSWDLGNWLPQHGTTSSGDHGAFKTMLHEGISVAQGHLHTASGITWHANVRRLLWAMQLGWLADRKAYAFAYGKEMKRKPIINCGVVLEGGTLPIVIPMPL